MTDARRTTIGLRAMRRSAERLAEQRDDLRAQRAAMVRQAHADGIGQDEIAEALGISRQMVGKILRLTDEERTGT